MADQVAILGIAGSLRKTSYNKGALSGRAETLPRGRKARRLRHRRFAALQPGRGAQSDAEGDRLQQRIRARGRHPHRHAGIQLRYRGVLKNAIDCASRPYGDSAWNGKPVAVMSASVGLFGGVRPSTSCASASST